MCFNNSFKVWLALKEYGGFSFFFLDSVLSNQCLLDQWFAPNRPQAYQAAVLPQSTGQLQAQSS